MLAINVPKSLRPKNSKSFFVHGIFRKCVQSICFSFLRLQKHSKEHNATEGKRRGRTKMFKKCYICKVGFKTEVEYNMHMKAGNHISEWFYIYFLENFAQNNFILFSSFTKTKKEESHRLCSVQGKL